MVVGTCYRLVCLWCLSQVIGEGVYGGGDMLLFRVCMVLGTWYW